MADLPLGDYHQIQAFSDAAEINLSLRKGKKCTFTSSSSTSKGFYEYYVDVKAKGRYELDPSGSFIICKSSSCKANKYNSEQSGGDGDKGEITVTKDWSRTFSIEKLRNTDEFAFEPLVAATSPKRPSPPPPPTEPSATTPRPIRRYTGGKGEAEGKQASTKSGRKEIAMEDPDDPEALAKELAALEMQNAALREQSALLHEKKTVRAILFEEGISELRGKTPKTKPATKKQGNGRTNAKKKVADGGGAGGGLKSEGGGKSEKSRRGTSRPSSKASIRGRKSTSVPDAPKRASVSKLASTTKANSKERKVSSKQQLAKAEGGDILGEMLSDLEHDLLSPAEKASMERRFVEFKLHAAEKRFAVAREEYEKANAAVSKLRRELRKLPKT